MFAEDYGKGYSDAVWNDLKTRLKEHIEMFFAGFSDELLTNK